MNVNITVQCDTNAELHELDRDVAGIYPIEVSDDSEDPIEDALDEFHDTIPIKVLDDFYIEASVEPAAKKPDFLDDHLIITGVSEEVAEKIKNRLRAEF